MYPLDNVHVHVHTELVFAQRISMNEFKKLRKSVRDQAIKAGIIRLVANRRNVSRATVSRTFAGKYDSPNPGIVADLHKAMIELGIPREFKA